MKEAIIEVNHLVHCFGDLVAVNGFDFSVNRGEVLGLLGPNGAGKTTTIRLLNGLFPPTSGTIRVLGLDPVTEGDKVREQSGVLTETPALYERLTAWQNLEFFGTLAGMAEDEWRSRSRDLLTFFGLENRAEEKVGNYSKGMKQRLALVRALLNRPPLLYLDEPTAGLDPEAALQVHELISSICLRDGQTVVICTHNLVEAQRLCDRVVVLNQGNVLALGSLEELQAQYAAGVQVHIELLGAVTERQKAVLCAVDGILELKAESDNEIIIQVESIEIIPDLAAVLVQENARLMALKPHHISLEEVYFKLQDQARGGGA